MSAGARRGATPAAVAVMNGNVDRALRTTTELAPCPICRMELEFDTGAYGQTLERCKNPTCMNRVWHSPIADGALIPERPKKPRKKVTT